MHNWDTKTPGILIIVTTVIRRWPDIVSSGILTAFGRDRVELIFSPRKRSERSESHAMKSLCDGDKPKQRFNTFPSITRRFLHYAPETHRCFGRNNVRPPADDRGSFGRDAAPKPPNHKNAHGCAAFERATCHQ